MKNVWKWNIINLIDQLLNLEVLQPTFSGHAFKNTVWQFQITSRSVSITNLKKFMSLSPSKSFKA